MNCSKMKQQKKALIKKNIIPEPVMPKTDIPTKEAEKPQEDASSDFDLMGAIGKLL